MGDSVGALQTNLMMPRRECALYLTQSSSQSNRRLPLPTARHGTCLAAFASHLYVPNPENASRDMRDVDNA